MSMSTPAFSLDRALERLAQAAKSDPSVLSPGAVANIRQWLTEPRYAKYAPVVAEHLERQAWKVLDDAFWTVIPFGTGGRRGRMYPIGCNAINERTIGESAQGLAEYVKEHAQAGSELRCAIAYDTRHGSIEFAQLCAEIMVAAGFRVFFLQPHRSTPELSFLVRRERCHCGIMVTASHNPPSDNAVKCYWSTGGQILPPHDKGVIDRVMRVEDIRRVDFSKALQAGQIVMCAEETDAAYFQALAAQRFSGPRDIKVLYSPLHGVGSCSVPEALRADGFSDVTIFAPHAAPDGDFPNVPGHVANPENPAVFQALIETARSNGTDLVLATDPDCDRLGCAAPLTLSPKSEWLTLTGNQIAALLADFILEQRRSAGHLSREHYLVKTLVTTEMLRRIGDSYGVRTHGDLQVGFKWIGGVMDEQGPDRFVLGAEESHGYLVGQYARDKDGAVAAMLLAEAAASAKAKRRSLHEKLDSLYWQHGYHAEGLVNLTMSGAAGMSRMQALMEKFRHVPPQALGGLQVVARRDYGALTITRTGEPPQALSGPRGDMVILDLDQPGNYVAIRPSGTEPKVKIYMFTFVPAELLADLEDTKRDMGQRLAAWETELRALAEAV